MKRGPIIVHAVVVLAAELLLLAAVIASGPSVAAALLAGAGLITFAIEDMWLVMRFQSREKAAETAQHMGDAMVKVGAMLDLAVRTATTSGDAAGMGVVIDFMSDADMLPAAAEIAVQAGTETAA